jgi:hypothetical protein
MGQKIALEEERERAVSRACAAEGQLDDARAQAARAQLEAEEAKRALAQARQDSENDAQQRCA